MVVLEHGDASESSGEGLQVLHIAADDSGDDPFATWVVEKTIDVIARLRDILLGGSPPSATKIAVVVIVDEQPDAWKAAAADGLCDGLRGAVGALTLERGASLRLNLVLASAAATSELEETLAFLASPSANFVAGSTFDLRTPS